LNSSGVPEPLGTDYRRRADATPRIYLISDRKLTGERGLVETVRLALMAMPALATMTTTRSSDPREPAQEELRASQVAVQLREKDLGGRALVELGQALREVTAAAGARLFVNDRIDVALAIGADGVHLGGGAPSPAEVEALAPHLAIAVSTHSLAAVARAAADAHVTFVVFGPVYDTPSKRGWGFPPTGPSALERAAAHPIPVVALGGIDASNAGACARAGAHGLGCIRAILGAANPADALTKIWSAWGQKRRVPS
jgi:thiamine-phosphate pyrophosphorylase